MPNLGKLRTFKAMDIRLVKPSTGNRGILLVCCDTKGSTINYLGAGVVEIEKKKNNKVLD